jgi:hypothetical protein
MATLKTSYGAATTITITLASLANNASVTSTAVTNATNLYTDVLVELIIVTAAGSAATGYAEVFVKGSIDNTDFPSDGADRKVATIATPTVSTTYKTVFNVAAAYGGSLPQFWQIRVRNATGAALSSTGNSSSYSGILLTSV